MENLVERVVIMSPEDVVTAEDVAELLLGAEFKSQPVVVGQVIPMRDAVELLERELLTKALASRRSTREVAAALGLNQSTVVRKLRRYGLA